MNETSTKQFLRVSYSGPGQDRPWGMTSQKVFFWIWKPPDQKLKV